MLFLPTICDFIRKIACVREVEGLQVEWNRSGQPMMSIFNDLERVHLVKKRESFQKSRLSCEIQEC